LQPQKQGMDAQRAPDSTPAHHQRQEQDTYVQRAPESTPANEVQWFPPLAASGNYFNSFPEQKPAFVSILEPSPAPDARITRKKTLVASDLILKGSPSALQKPKEMDPEPQGSAPILSGFDPEIVQESLRFGDTITIIPDNVNGLVAFAGADNVRPWLELLDDSHEHFVSMPPNLRDCHWRILPAPLYIESKKYAKMLTTSKWDEGKGLELPALPPHVDIDQYASEIIKKTKLSTSKHALLVDLLVQSGLVQEEKESNKVEQDRVRGNELRYGAAVILVHESTNLVLTATKQRAIEGERPLQTILPRILVMARLQNGRKV
jgi:hypothetical protein